MAFYQIQQDSTGKFRKLLCIFLSALMLFYVLPVYSVAESADEDKITIVIDPGHGGSDGGAGSFSHAEKYYNWKNKNGTISNTVPRTNSARRLKK